MSGLRQQILGLAEDNARLQTAVKASLQAELDRAKAMKDAARPVEVLKGLLDDLTGAQERQQNALGEYNEALGELSGDALVALLDSAKKVKSGLDLLDDADLSSLEDSIQGALERMVEFSREVDSVTDSIQDQFDKLTGDDLSIESRQFARDLQELQELLDQAVDPQDRQKILEAIEQRRAIYEAEKQEILETIEAEKGRAAATQAAAEAQRQVQQEQLENARLARREAELQVKQYKDLTEALGAAKINASGLRAELSAIAQVDLSSTTANLDELIENLRRNRSRQ